MFRVLLLLLVIKGLGELDIENLTERNEASGLSLMFNVSVHE